MGERKEKKWWKVMGRFCGEKDEDMARGKRKRWWRKKRRIGREKE